jgi:hypothetical protein
MDNEMGMFRFRIILSPPGGAGGILSRITSFQMICKVLLFGYFLPIFKWFKKQVHRVH